MLLNHFPPLHYCRMVAIEPSSEMAAICRSKGLDVAEATVEELQGYEGQPDLLTAFELLEHLMHRESCWKRHSASCAPAGIFS